MAFRFRSFVCLISVAAVACSSAPEDASPDDTTATPGAVVGPGCRSNADCARLSYCSSAMGQCGFGTCVPRGVNVFCVSTDRPVCGCDGQTYRNDCYAAKAGASLVHDGECVDDPPLSDAPYGFSPKYL